MKFKFTNLVPWNKRDLIKTIMRTFIFLFCTTILAFVPDKGLSQNAKIKIDENMTVSVNEVFNLIESQTDYNFIFRADLFENIPNVDLEKGVIRANKLLDYSLAKTVFTYEFTEDEIIILKRTPFFEGTDLVELPQQTITGKVTDMDGNPIPGVNVMVGPRGSTVVRGVATDFDGNYSIDAVSGEVIRFSFVGYVTQEFTISDQNLINVVLLVETSELETVVLVGYGTTKKEDLVGSVSSAKMEEIGKTGFSNVESALAGRLAGVNVSRTTGAPGEGAFIQIRGYSSFSGSNEPLYIIDGIPYQPNGAAVTTPLGSGNYDRSNPLNFISANDIEKIDVLKDASSAAIYGSQAANGVVIITTKKGKENDKVRTEISYRSNFESISNRFDVLSKEQFLNVQEEATIAAGGNFDRESYDLGADTDWQEEAIETAIYNELNLGFSGGLKDSKTVFSTGINMTNQEGIIGSENKRFSGRFSVQGSPMKGTVIGTNLVYSNTKNTGNGAPFRSVAFSRPDLSIDQTTTNSDPYKNHLWRSKIIKRKSNNVGIIGSLFGELELLDNLKFRSNFGFTTYNNSGVNFDPKELYDDGDGRRINSSSESRSLVWDNTITYDNSWNNKHNLNVVGGVSWQNKKFKNQSVTGRGFPNDDLLNNLGSANSIISHSSGEVESALSSFFFRSKYNFSNKYFVTFTGRVDRSTKFGPNNQWGYFPSGGLAWKISDEKFMENSPFNFLKLRTSVGVTGLATFPDFLYNTVFTSGNYYNGTNGIAPTSLPNPDIGWEKTTQADVGLEFKMFNNKFGGEIGYYSKYTTDLLLYNALPYELGGGTLLLSNVGEISNKGYEMSLYGNVVNSDDFSWNTDFNITFQKNTIEKLNSAVLSKNAGLLVKIEEGDSFGTLWGYKTDGLITSQQQLDDLNAAAPDGIYRSPATGVGDRLFVDVNGDGEVTADDRVKLGSGVPDFYGGFNNIFKYKDFELTLFFNFSYGAKGFPWSVRNNSNGGLNFGRQITNYTTRVLDAWSPDNPDGKWPRNILNDPNNNRTQSDAIVSDASYIKLKNVELSYKLPLKFNATLFVSATNLLTITNWDGQDPEQISPSFNGAGVSSGSYPFSKSFSIGGRINL